MVFEIMSGMGGIGGDQAPDARNRTLPSAAEGIGRWIACYLVCAESMSRSCCLRVRVESRTGKGDSLQRREELSYLDVVGPTIKSRLVVPGRNPDHIEECLSIGISKYIVDDVDCLEILRDVVDDAGKELVLNVIK